MYIANDNHTDYGWNDTVANYDASMLSELDYYLGRVGATAGNATAEQTRFNADCWYYLYLFQKNRSPAQFQSLINALQSGRITVPLNPFVTLYGALPTEAAIRAGYYPGRIERQYGVSFLTAQEMENATIPWGMASLWAGSHTKYSWKGLCGCNTKAPYNDRTDEVFRWQGPDNKTLLMKWYRFTGGNASWGGYAEARNNLSQPAVQSTIDHFSTAPPMLPMTGLFGGGWDDVTYETDAFETLAQAWNAAHPGGDQVVVSNEVDYFQELESHGDQLTTLRGGWGNDWDLWPMALAERTAQTRRAIERLRTAEALAAVVHSFNPAFWPPRQAALEVALVDYFKYFEHTWGATGSVPLSSVVGNKKTWAQNVDDTVTQVEGDAATNFAAAFTTPSGEDRFVVFNPLAFARTDYADLPITTPGPFVVTDVVAGTEAPNQIVTRDGNTYLRILAGNVPSLGYRVYRYAAGTPAPLANAAAVSGSRIESDRYRVDLGARGELTSAFDKTTGAGVEMAGSGLNDFGSGTAAAPVAENVGAVSATIRADVSGTPNRRVRVTLFKNVDRIEVEDEILQNTTAGSFYRYNFSLANPQIRFEEVGGVARPGLAAQGGDFLAGTRADFMTLNHFVNFDSGSYNVTLSSRDAYAMRVGNSTATSFDLPTSEVSVLAVGNPSNSDIADQGGAAYFLDRFALRGASGAYAGADAMKMSLAHQNPLRAVALARSQSGPLNAATASFLSVSAPNVVVTAFKPAEEGARGWIVRLWEMAGSPTNFNIDASAFAPTAASTTSLIETDVAAAPVSGGVIAASLSANEIKAYRFSGAASGTATATAVQGTPTPTAPLCVITTPGQTTWIKGRITASRINDGVSGNDMLSISGRFTMATGRFSIDPMATGAQLELRSGTGALLLSVTLPSGAYASPGPGWLKGRTGKRYTFQDRHRGGTGGINKIVLIDRGGGVVRVTVTGTKATLNLTPTDAPLAATIVLGGPASGTAGECGELKFAAAACKPNAAGTKISCK